MRFGKIRKPISRLWMQSMTDDAILDAWGLWTRRGFAIWKVYPPAATQADVPSISHAATAKSRRKRWGWYIALWRARLALTRALRRSGYTEERMRREFGEIPQLAAVAERLEDGNYFTVRAE